MNEVGKYGVQITDDRIHHNIDRTKIILLKRIGNHFLIQILSEKI